MMGSGAGEFVLGTFSIAGGPAFGGVVIGEQAVSLRAVAALGRRHGTHLMGGDSVLGLLETWPENFAALRAILGTGQSDALPFVPLSVLRIHPPVDLPRQILCTGANYRKHVIDLMVDQVRGPDAAATRAQRYAETAKMMDDRAINGMPYAFSKLPSSTIGPNDPIVVPAGVEKPDWELELAVIIGRPARHVSRGDALDYVAGYTIANDVTARDRIPRPDIALGPDFLAGKSAPSFLPLGPFLVPAAFVPEPHQLHITLKLNGETMQDESTSDMIFDVARQIEYLSSRVQLWPGDVICTGSPAGNGTHYNRFLRPGDVVDSTITGLGHQRNAVVAEAR